MFPAILLESLLPAIGKAFGSSIGGDLSRNMGGLLNGLGTSLSSMAIGGLIGGKEGLESMRNSITNQGLTGAQREANAFSAAEAQKARDFSEMQRQTQYQTAVNDMTAAGLNPAMMYQGAGAAASPTPSAAADSVAPQSNKITDMLSLISGMAQLKQIEAQTKNIEANTNKTNIEAENTGELMQSEISFNRSNVDKNTAEIDNLNQAIAESQSRVKLNEKELDVKEAMISVYGSEVTKNEADAALARAQAFFAEANEYQIRELTPALKALHEANAHLAREKALTEGEYRFYYRKAAYAQEALNTYYYAQASLTNVNKQIAEADLQVHQNDAMASNVKARETGYKYDYQDFRNTQNYRMWSAVGSLMSGAGSVGSAAAGFGRNSVMRGWQSHSPFSQSMNIPYVGSFGAPHSYTGVGTGW